MKTPISYYGGKQTMLKYIIPLIPKHKTYVEPFAGGLAVLFAKEVSKAEIINDLNGNVTNFYEQLKGNFKELQELIIKTPHGRDVYKRAKIIYDTPFLFTPLVKAWAFWVCTNQGYSNQVGSWRTPGKCGKESLLIENKKNTFSEQLANRISKISIENIDALKLIERLDNVDTFFYIDPPYVGAKQGHYSGYTQDNFNDLLSILSNIKGKFLLSSYPNDELTNFVKSQEWNYLPIQKSLNASRIKDKKKVECLTYNYTI